jgi:hypothetical protein
MLPSKFRMFWLLNYSQNCSDLGKDLIHRQSFAAPPVKGGQSKRLAGAGCLRQHHPGNCQTLPDGGTSATDHA